MISPKTALVLLIGVIGVGASVTAPETRRSEAAEEPLVFPGTHWKTSHPASLGLDEARLEQLARNVGGDGCVVWKGLLVKSWGDIASRKDWASAAKPVLSTLLLLAVQEGRLPSVDARVANAGWAFVPKDADLTFRQLANMVSGYSRGEAPGAAWAYNDVAIELYARSLERVFQQPLEAAFQQRLAPLQFEDEPFLGSRRGVGVAASPRDFARLGWLWLNRGQWNGHALIASALFTNCIRPGVAATLPRTTTAGEDYLKVGSYGGGTDQTPQGPGVYGFNFWFNERLPDGQLVWPAAPPDTYQANGMWNRDTVTVIPSRHLVVVIRGGHPGPFEPGAEGGFNENLRLLLTAVGSPH